MVLVRISLILMMFLSGSVLATHPQSSPSDQYLILRKAMVNRDLIRMGLNDKKIVEAFLSVPRHEFVLPEFKAKAYEEENVPIGEGQTLSTPYVTALMTKLLSLKGDEKVLELGTGSGYHTAVLSHLCKAVYTVDISKKMKESAEERLTRLGYKNIHFRLGEGTLGWPEESPFDAILVDFAAESIIPDLIAQLKEGGRLVIPVGKESQKLNLIIKENGKGKRIVTPFYEGKISGVQLKKGDVS